MTGTTRRRTMHMVMHARKIATGRRMNEDAEVSQWEADANDLQALAVAAGVELSPERAAALVSQAAPHFALLRAIDVGGDPATEPAAEFHLDRWRRAADG
ncbi:MAG TPA: hypothetical protein VFI22_05675 [Thermomicrobiales bacterium]|nr:hypothetical protein [Thermomicrobiales bacterium]